MNSSMAAERLSYVKEELEKQNMLPFFAGDRGLEPSQSSDSTSC